MFLMNPKTDVSLLSKNHGWIFFGPLLPTNLRTRLIFKELTRENLNAPRLDKSLMSLWREFHSVGGIYLYVYDRNHVSKSGAVDF